MFESVLLAFALTPLQALQAEPDAEGGVTRHALLVGVQDYPEAQDWPRLSGPRADVNALRLALVEQAGFRDEDIRVLLDEQATRAAIESAFQELAAACGPEDLLLFYFAGHGSQLPDQNGDENDGLDETLIPFDTLSASGEPNDLRDDLLGEWIALANKSTDNVVLVFDCCNSGTNVRGEGELVQRGIPAHLRGFASDAGGVADELPREGEGAGAGWIDQSLKYVSLSACRSAESAHEVSAAGELHGLFTLSFLQELSSASLELSYLEFLERVRRRVRERRPDQTPVIEGSLRGNLLLQRRGAWRTPSFGLQQTPGGLVLEAGLVQGLSVGSVLAVQASTAIEDRPGERLGRIRLDAVRGTRAEASWVEPPPEPLAQGGRGRAFLLEFGPRETRFGYAILGGEDEPARLARLVEDLDSTGMLRRVERSEALWCLDLEGEGGARRWVLRSPSGRRLPLEESLVGSGPQSLLRAGLVRLARAQIVRGSRPAAAAGSLAVDIDLFRVDSAGERIGAIERDAGGVLSMTPGSLIRARVHNRSSEPVFVSLVVISPDGAVFVQPLTPTLDDAIPAGGTAQTPQPLEVQVASGSEAFYREASDTYRWIVTTRYHDLSSLEQGSVTQLSIQRGVGPSRPQLPEESWLTRTMEVRLELPR